MKNLPLKVKLISGFIAVTLITLAVGFVGLSGVANLGASLNLVAENSLPSIQNLLAFQKAAESIRVAGRTLLNPGLDPKDRQRQFDNVSRTRREYENAWKEYDAIPKAPEEDALWKNLSVAWEALRVENNKFFDMAREIEKTGIQKPMELMMNLERFKGEHLRLMAQVSKAVLERTEFSGGEDPGQCGLSEWMSGYKTDNPKIGQALKDTVSIDDKFHQALNRIKSLLKNGDFDPAVAAYTAELIPGLEAIVKQCDVLREEAVRADLLYAKINEQALVVSYEKQVEAFGLLDKLIDYNKKKAEAARADSKKTMARVKMFAMGGMILGSAIALVLGIILTLSISRPIHRVIEGLSEGAEQVAAASAQIASTSQQLAEGTSEQAAAVEETSSSLEEMSSMTRQNAQNSNEANVSMNETSKVVEEAQLSMKELTTSMDEITQASEETQKIIKTIDEIAFQTNLLALNAAVEAARAGEAGSGFAVVANEVRNLALRAAEAAKNTANLIEGTVNKIRSGSELVSKAGDAFERVAVGARKVGDLVGEISAASGEQAQGVEQLNRAVNEMDKVIQQNASNAEEAAAAAEEMNAQAENMKDFVTELVSMVGGTRKSTVIQVDVRTGGDDLQNKVTQLALSR